MPQAFRPHFFPILKCGIKRTAMPKHFLLTELRVNSADEICTTRGHKFTGILHSNESRVFASTVRKVKKKHGASNNLDTKDGS